MIQAKFKDQLFTKPIEGWFPVEFSEWPLKFMRLCHPYTPEWLSHEHFRERMYLNVRLLEFKHD